MTRIFQSTSVLILLLGLCATAFAEALRFELAKTQSCGCCAAYAELVEKAGHTVAAENLPMATLMELKSASGVPAALTSCHTSTVNGYVFEGHVPLADIERFLKEKPADAIGLGVAGMPYGSPGMGSEETRDAFEVHVIKKDGSTAVFNSYAAIE
jgi:hypothetical protein